MFDPKNDVMISVIWLKFKMDNGLIVMNWNNERFFKHIYTHTEIFKLFSKKIPSTSHSTVPFNLPSNSRHQILADTKIRKKLIRMAHN